MFRSSFHPILQKVKKNLSLVLGEKVSFAPSPIRPLDQKGNALIMASIFMIVAITLVTIGVKLTSNAARQSKALQTNVAEADNAARAGLEDALNYFIRKNASGSSVLRAFDTAYYPGQTTQYASGVSYIDQPFNPQYSSNPKQSDTIDQTGLIGLVNEYGLDDSNLTTANLIARYEVKKQGPPPTPTDPLAVHDISGQRAVSELDGDGTVWSITSTGYIYKRLDHTYTGTYEQGICPAWNVAYSSAPNQIVAKVTVNTEFRQVALNLPTTNVSTATGAVYCESVTQVQMLDTETKLSGAVTAGTNFAVVGMTEITP